MSHQVLIPVLNHGLPDRFVQHGTREEMLADASLDATGLLKAIEAFAGRHGRRASISQPLASG
jgi:1-deoxy-D-xylulose-5-phosphate synthase